MNEQNQPLRLLRKRGHWTLEVTKLVAIDQHVLRPERRRVNGTDSVVRHLKERCAPSLVRQALDLLIGDDDGSDRAFELEGEHWIQLQDDAAQDSLGPSNAALLTMLGELRGELTTLRALHEAVRGRLAALERRGLQHPPQDTRRPAVRGAVRRDLTKPPPAPEPPVVAAPTQLSAELAAAVPVVEAAAVAAAPLKSAAIQLPSHPDVVTCLKQLLGADAGLRAESVPLPSDLDAFYVARLVDSADQEVGAILLDLRAGAELGGRLLGLPAAAVEEQAKSEPSSDVLDSMNEVVNNLGGFVNRANPELRVRVRPLEKPGSAAPDWLGQPSARGGSATPSGGRLWLVAR